MANEPSDNDHRATRRAILKSSAGLTALAAGVTPASAHLESNDGAESNNEHDHTDGSLHGDSSNAELLNYHSLGDVGPASETGSNENPHYGGITELRVDGDYAYVGIFSSKEPTSSRGMAILDISQFNEASSTKELRNAELEVVSFLQNDNAGSAVMDVKVSETGDYVFISKQPYTALFNEVDPTPGTDGESTSASASALQAVDVSDPENPVVTGTYDVWDTGPHNAFAHTVNGTEYVFAVKDLNDGTAGLYVFQFEPVTGSLVLVNKWDLDGNLLEGATSTDGGLTYMHDIVVQDDPITGKPYGYLSYMDAGLWMLDLSDPTDIQPIGWADIARAHYAEPTPTLVNGKRVIVAGQELSSQEEGSSGKVFLLDADGIEDGFDGSANIDAVDAWEWRSNVTFSNFTMSPHNFNVTEKNRVHLGHYHGGIRYLKIDSGNWTLTEKGHYRPSKNVPEGAKMEGLNHSVPFTWCAVEQNGVTFASDISTGVYAINFKPE